MRLENKNPTITEREMFRLYGLYLVKGYDDGVAYAPIHLSDGTAGEYPDVIENADEDAIESDHMIIFDSATNFISLNGWCDVDLLRLVCDRAKELGMQE